LISVDREKTGVTSGTKEGAEFISVNLVDLHRAIDLHLLLAKDADRLQKRMFQVSLSFARFFQQLILSCLSHNRNGDWNLWRIRWMSQSLHEFTA
jgi:hypothetical protein